MSLRACRLPGLLALGRLGGLGRGDLGLAGRGRLRAEALREPLDAALGIDQLLATREERVAGAADFEVQFLLGRFRLEGVAAGATRLDVEVLWMNSRLHCELLVVKRKPRV